MLHFLKSLWKFGNCKNIIDLVVSMVATVFVKSFNFFSGVREKVHFQGSVTVELHDPDEVSHVL